MKTKLKRVQLQERPQIIMPDDVLFKIKHLCNVMPTVEWSGILLYDVKGTIKNPTKMRVTLRDIILMDKGQKAFTSYNFNEKKRDQSGYSDRHIDYCEENEKALTWKIGHIHSHNTMRVFFSGTDLEELDDNSPSHNFYLSLIVNNAMDFTAKISFIASAKETVKTNLKALDEAGKEYKMKTVIFEVEKQELYMYDCDIKSNKNTVPEEDFFARNLKSIMEKESPRIVTQSPHTPYMGNTANASLTNKQVIPDRKFSPNGIPVINNHVKPFTYNVFDSVGKMFLDEEEEELKFSMITEISSESYEVIKQLLSEEDTPDGEVPVPDLLGNLKVVDSKIFAKNALEKYPMIIGNVFMVGNNSYLDDEGFLDITEEVIDTLEFFEGEYPVVSPLIVGLKLMLNQFLQTV